MRKVFALIRAGWLTAASYRLRMLLSVGGVLISVIPVYFIAGALQPVMAEAIKDEGAQYFGFLVIGMIALTLINTAVHSLPREMGAGITRGTLEGLLSTPTRVATLLAGMAGFNFVWAAIRMLMLLVAGWILGAHVEWSRFLPAAAVLLLTVAAYVPFGVIAGALILVFRTAGPLPQGVLYASTLLGGVYYPTNVIPSWIQDISQVVPVTYGLRALRRILLEGSPGSAVGTDVGVLLAFTVILLLVSVVVFKTALHYAKHAGTLTQY